MTSSLGFESEVGRGLHFRCMLPLGGRRGLANGHGQGSCFSFHSEDAGRTWSDPIEIQIEGVDVRSENAPSGDLGLKVPRPRVHITSLCRLSDGTIGALLFHTLPSDYYVAFVVSGDEGRTFTRVTRLRPGGPRSAVFTAALTGLSQLRSGRLVAAIYQGVSDYEHEEYKGEGTGHSFRGAYGSYQGRRTLVEGHDHTPEFYWTEVLYSDDLGGTWWKSPNNLWAWLNNPETHESYHSPLGEPVVVELDDDHLLMFMRSVLGRIYQAESHDGGENWSVPMANDLSASGSPCALKKIPSTGDLLVVWNQVTGEEIQRGCKRSRICCSVSSDGGETWNNVKTFDVATGLQPVGKLNPSPIRNYRALDDVGEIPVPFINFDYADIAFVEDLALIGYAVEEMRPTAEWPDYADILGGREFYGRVKAVRNEDL